jgi:Heterokaryon incompatibility protein (HET)
MDDQDMAVTQNLYVALSYLQDQDIPRIIWVDAVCINQSDDVEKSLQLRLMAEIYAKASRVIVWLGEAYSASNEALEAIRQAASIQPLKIPNIPEQAISMFLNGGGFNGFG